MRRLLELAALLSLTVLLGGGGAAVQAAAGADDDVKSIDKTIYDAIAKRDATRLADLLGADFTLTNTFGEVYDKQRFLTACCTGAATSRTLSLASTDAKVRTYGTQGDTVVISARTEMKFVKDNQNQQIAWRSLRVYVKSGTTWKLVAEQRTSIG